MLEKLVALQTGHPDFEVAYLVIPHSPLTAAYDQTDGPDELAPFLTSLEDLD
jgi:hypothetical protein